MRITAFSRWAAHSQGIQLDRAGRLAQRLLEQGEASADPVVRTYGWHAWGIHQWDVGNIGEAFRYLSRSRSTVLDDLADVGEDTLRRDLRLLGPAMLALMTALHGDADTARALFDTIKATADGDAYVLTVWAAFACTAAALSGDPVRALHTAERGSALDPEFSFVSLGSYQRLTQCWAHAVTGEDPAGSAAQAQRLITSTGRPTTLRSGDLARPPRRDVACRGQTRRSHGSPRPSRLGPRRLRPALRRELPAPVARAADGARGAPVAAVRAAAERARALSAEREAHLFARRAEELLAGLADT
ncbi:hypothetical protein [Streptomyces griseorubiginosus]|uniref:hypothetical protein n=1 Tax=Streptomyces griseorubiginosus TaxID=67304 RepID=UPI001AD736F5|nr:hypothetical protein [Streptomyces griseorubiginosus]